MKAISCPLYVHARKLVYFGVVVDHTQDEWVHH